MSPALFLKFSDFIQNELGIKMPEAKRTMLQARLQKRLRYLGLSSFDDYFDFVFSKKGQETELVHMIDAITTNKTDFFREPQHFEYLVDVVLPKLITRVGAGVRRKAMVWSAGCSTGEEVYTLGMVLSEFGNRHHQFGGQFRFSILGTDISTKVLKEAVLGIYDHEKIAPVPHAMRKRYLLRSKDKSKNLVRIAPELRGMVQFRRLNFMSEYFSLNESMDVIFCRNVLIYFDRENQEKVLNRLCRHLIPGGYLFTGHSETLNGLNVPLVQERSTIYRMPA